MTTAVEVSFTRTFTMGNQTDTNTTSITTAVPCIRLEMSHLQYRHQLYCTRTTSNYYTARITLHNCHVSICFLLKIKTSKNSQRFFYNIPIKVIQSVQLSSYGHQTTPNKGTILLASTPTKYYHHINILLGHLKGGKLRKYTFLPRLTIKNNI